MANVKGGPLTAAFFHGASMAGNSLFTESGSNTFLCPALYVHTLQTRNPQEAGMNARVWKYSIMIIAALSMAGLVEAKDRGDRKCGKVKGREQARERYDADGDGRLSREEREAMPKGLRSKRPGNRQSWAQHREKYDTDGDGKLSREEREAMPEGLTKKMRRPKRDRIQPEVDA
jgi:hypothetical protein